MSRRKARYERRQERRSQKRQENSAAVGSIEAVFNFNDLYRAGKECCKGVRWKSSAQRFEQHLFSGTAVRRRAVLEGKWIPSKYVHFMLAERGKIRPIDAPRIQDRQIHKLFTQKVLLPLYLPSMIWNNGASLRGKGFEFSKRELKKDLRYHFGRYGREGYIILLDFKQFFPTVSHEMVFQRHARFILNDELREVADGIVNTVPGGKGLPLGVEPSQAEMIAFPSDLDNYIKCQLSIKCAGHYMDDYYIIVPPDRNPEEIMGLAIQRAESMKLTVSRAKSRIVPLTKPFKYCKAKYSLTETGKVIVNGNKDSVRRARRKIRAFYGKIQSGEMSYEDLWTSVNGMMAYFESYNDHGRVLRLRRCFYAIFGFSPERIENFRKRDNVMKYIVHKRFKGTAICGYVNLPALTECEYNGGVICHDGKPICFHKSENAHQYFAINGDGRGMERGRLTQAIQKRLAPDPDPNAYDVNNERQRRWDKVWADEICQKYRRMDYDDYWLWSHDFFNADIDDLRHIASLIGAKEGAAA